MTRLVRHLKGIIILYMFVSAITLPDLSVQAQITAHCLVVAEN